MYRKYLITDKKSQIQKEFQFLADTLKTTAPEHIAFFAERAEKMENHRIYRFPNGYGASVVKGFFSFDKLEIAEIQFVSEAPPRRIPKKKRRRKKWEKNYLCYKVTDNLFRVETEEELKQVLHSIESRS